MRSLAELIANGMIGRSDDAEVEADRALVTDEVREIAAAWAEGKLTLDQVLFQTTNRERATAHVRSLGHPGWKNVMDALNAAVLKREHRTDTGGLYFTNHGIFTQREWEHTHNADQVNAAKWRDANQSWRR